MAEERARVLGHRQRPSSALEVAAAQWEKGRVAEAKEAQEEKVRLSLPGELPCFSLQQVSLQADPIEAAEKVGWNAYRPPREAKPRPRRLGGIAVGSLATRMIQRERVGGAGVVLDRQALALEQAAKRWDEKREADSPRR